MTIGKDHLFRISPGAILGLVMIFLALIVPAPFWIRWLRISEPSADLYAKLLTGARLFRAAMCMLGFWVALGSILRWWRDGAPRESRRFRWDTEESLLIVLLLISFLIRLYRLNQGLWQDEIIALLTYARAPFGDILTTFESQNQQFLFSLLAHTSFLIFGESASALRLPAVLFGVGSIAMLYVFGREVTTKLEALLASTLMAFTYQHVWFSQNGRGYSGLLFFTLFASWILVRALRENRPSLWLHYALASAFGIYTNNVMLFVVMGHFVIYVVHAVRSAESKAWILPVFNGFVLAGLITFVLHALTAPQMIGEPLADLSPVPLWRSPLWTLQDLARGLNLQAGRGLIGLAGFVVAGAGCFSYFRRRPIVLGLFFLPVVIGAGITIAIGHPLWPRFFIFAFGFVALIIVRGAFCSAELLATFMKWQPKRAMQLGIGLILAGTIVSAVAIPAAYRPKQDYAGALQFVNHVRHPEDVVALAGLAMYPYTQYYHTDWTVVLSLDQLNELRAQHPRTLVVTTFPVHLEAALPEISQSLQRDFKLLKKFDGSVEGGTVFVYTSEPEK